MLLFVIDAFYGVIKCCCCSVALSIFSCFAIIFLVESYKEVHYERRREARENRVRIRQAKGIISHLTKGKFGVSSKKRDFCIICFGVFQDADKVTSLPCKEIFHSTCIDQWLLIKNKCPFCNETITKELIDQARQNAERQSQNVNQRQESVVENQN